MRVALIGSKQLSISILQELIKAGHDVAAVYSRDDEPGMKIWHEQLGHASLKQAAIINRIPFYEGMKVNSQESLSLLQSLNLDVIFSCFWSEIFREPVLNIPRFGVFNLHTALLPKNQGSRPIPWSLINEEGFTGITLHKMMTGVDNGPLVDQRAVKIEASDNAESLYSKISNAGAELFAQCLSSFENGTFKLELQSLSQATYQPRGEPFGGQLNPYWSAAKTARLKAAFTFPPFRAWRNYPKVSGPSLKIIVTSRNENWMLNDIDPRLLKRATINSIGSSSLRKELKLMFAEITEKVGFSGLSTDTRPLFPIHDILNMKKVIGASLSEIKQDQLTDLSISQPYRYKNGLLEVPHFQVSEMEEVEILIKEAAIIANKNIHGFYLHLVSSELKVERLRDYCEENFSKHAEIVTFEHVCELFDTEYEKIST